MSVATRVATALSCPRCGGTPDPDGGPGLLARCPNCGVLGRIDDPEGLCRLVVMPRLERAAAAAFVGDALAERGIEREITIHRAEMMFLPYWRVVALVAGRVEGERRRLSRVIEREVDDQGRAWVVTREIDDGTEPVRREIQRRLVAVIAGCPMDELGIPTLDRQRQTAGALGVGSALDRTSHVRRFDPQLRRLGTFLDPLVPRTEAVDQAHDVVRARIDGLATGLLPGAEIKVETLTEDVSQFYYPVLITEFALGPLVGRAVIDGLSGRLASLDLPEGATAGADRRLAGLVALGVGALAGSIARLALVPPALLAGPDAGPIRVRLLAGAAILGAFGIAGVRSLVRQISGAASR